MFFKKTKKGNRQKGQVMILTVIFLGSAFMLMSALVALLVFYQFKQANDYSNTTISLYAADAALEKLIYKFFNTSDFLFPNCFNNPCIVNNLIDFDNDARADGKVQNFDNNQIKMTKITTTGFDRSQRTIRSLEIVFRVIPN